MKSYMRKGMLVFNTFPDALRNKFLNPPVEAAGACQSDLKAADSLLRDSSGMISCAHGLKTR